MLSFFGASVLSRTSLLTKFVVMNRTIKVAVLWFGLQCCSALKIISSQRSTKLRNSVTFEISTTISPSPSLQWLQYQHERCEYENPLHTNLKTIFQNGLRRSDGHIGMELESNQTMTTTSQSLSEIKDTEGNQDKKENKEIPSKPTISKRLLYKNSFLPSFDGFKAFLQSASQMWINGHAFSLNSKQGLLQKLKEKLLKAIENQFIMLWQGDDNTYVRARRSIFDESSINFPPEVALLSINFLTFAVFLIKLVLQVVNIVKGKHYSLTTFGMSTDSTSQFG